MLLLDLLFNPSLLLILLLLLVVVAAFSRRLRLSSAVALHGGISWLLVPVEVDVSVEMSVDFRLGEVLVGWRESWWVTEGRAALRSAWIICCGKGRLAQSMASRLLVSAAPVMTCLSLASISAREMPGICCSGTKHRCTYSRTAGGHSTRFLVSVEEAGAAVMVVVVVEVVEAVEEALRASVRRAWTGVYAGAVGPGESVSAAQPPSEGVLPLADARHAVFISEYDVNTM